VFLLNLSTLDQQLVIQDYGSTFLFHINSQKHFVDVRKGALAETPSHKAYKTVA